MDRPTSSTSASKKLRRFSRVRVLAKFFAGSPPVARVAPFVIFVLLTAAQGKFGAASAYWFYFAKTIAGAWLVWEMKPFVPEMRWAISWEAIVVGVGIFAIWVGLDPFYPHLMKNGAAWNPNLQFGENSALAWLMIAARILGSTFIVPPLEEVFYRSFLYRYLASQNFLSVPLNRFLPFPFFAAAIVFGFSHNEWLAGILCGAAFQWLVIRRNRLGDAMTAHAITNFLLGIWIVWRGAWNFW
jgi:CAAX prenyl protease-like protein